MKVTVMVIRIVMWGQIRIIGPPAPILLKRERFLIPMVVKVTYMVMGLVMCGQIRIMADPLFPDKDKMKHASSFFSHRNMNILEV